MDYCAYCGNTIQEGYGYRVPVSVRGALIGFHLACGQPFRDDMLRIEQGHRMSRMTKPTRIIDVLMGMPSRDAPWPPSNDVVIGPADPMEVLHEQAE